MHIGLFHGFNVSDNGQRSTDLLRPPLEEDGYKVLEGDYRWKGLIGVKLCNKSMAKLIAGLFPPGGIAIGHSNGSNLIHWAAHYGAAFSRVIYINPALDRKADLAPQIAKALVIACPHDLPVLMARWIPWVSWGSMGRDGYMGKDPRYVNVLRTDPCSHSDIFENLSTFYPTIRDFIQEAETCCS
jgi:pimeloyl-ACP methyl ester carboxylesterase